jgi:hypothetical protein
LVIGSKVLLLLKVAKEENHVFEELLVLFGGLGPVPFLQLFLLF